MKQQLSIAQAADLLDVHTSTIRRWIAQGKLRAHYYGPRVIRIDPADLQALAAPVNPVTFEHVNGAIHGGGAR